MLRPLQIVAALFFATAVQTAHAQDFLEEDPYGESDDRTFIDSNGPETPTAERAEADIEEFDTDGRYIYLICIYGQRDKNRAVRNKCPEVKAQLRSDYPRKRIIQINNPTEERLERIKEHQKDNIALVIIVTHSTPGPTDEDWDVWDTDLDPIDFAECFYDEFIIWNGCYSRDICEQADNILPVQCDEDFLPYEDDTWREVAACLFGTSEAVTQDDVCEEIFGDDWRNREDDE